MNVQAFIPNWKAPLCDAEQVQKILSVCCPATILNAYDVSFREQWQEAVQRFTGDIMVWAMADCRPRKWAEAYPEMVKWMSRGDVGVWAPLLTDPQQPLRNAVEGERGVFEVGTTNLIFVAVSRQLLDAMPPIEMHRNGWMYDYLMTAVARKHGWKMLVDTRFQVRHTSGSIYPLARAQRETDIWLSRLSPEWRLAVDAIWDETHFRKAKSDEDKSC